jgi:beta-xylosidase
MTESTIGARPGYRDPALPIDQRVQDLLSTMTLREKVAQLGSAWVFELAPDAELSDEAMNRLMSEGLGQITRVSGASGRGSRAAATTANAIQAFLRDRTRLGIPAILHEEVCSGLMARESTVFPQAIGVASTWDPGLAEAMGVVVREEMRALGTHQGLAPVLDVARDPRWGRTEETFGEDPHLVATMGMAFITGLQGADLENGVIATAKHFVGYGASEGGLNWAPAHIPTRELHEVYLHPFEAAVGPARLESVMNGYHEIDGVPLTANRDLFTGLLRETWGFEGTVVSDYFSVRQLADYHRLVVDRVGAAATAATAGIDVELPGTDCYGEPLLRAIDTGLVDVSVIDDSVRRVLRQKFALGLFDEPFVDADLAPTIVGSDEHRSMSRTIAVKSLVLLHNDGTLPLAAAPGRVAVIGPNADTGRNLLCDYSYQAHIESLTEMREDNVFGIPLAGNLGLDGEMRPIPTVREALVERFGPAVAYAQGCEVNGASTDGFAEAVELAAASDLVVMVVGDKAGLADDCTSGESRDRSSLDLPGVQEQLVKAVAATGTPMVLVLVAGRPCGSVESHESAAASLMAWLPGTEGAAAIADVLTGKESPGGKLPISFPRHVGQVPVYYGHKVSGGRSHWQGDYVDSPAGPLYPFGHGLSYTSFEISELSVDQREAGVDEVVTVNARLTNTGDRDGDEVVQLYVSDKEASLTRPVLELKGYARVSLDARQSSTLRFELPVGQLGFYDHQARYVVEPGEIDVFIGTSSRDLHRAGAFNIVADHTGAVARKVFNGSVSIAREA